MHPTDTSSAATNRTTAPRYEPIRIADDTFVVQATAGEGSAPLAAHLNMMVIRGAEPIVVDTGAPVFRERYLDDLCSLVDPVDVRWVFLSHEDVDHAGNLEAVMAACPRATLITSWFQTERLGGLPWLPPERCRWIGADEQFEANGRTYVTARPPLYDSPTSRGLLDTATGAYWAGDCFAVPVETGTADVAMLAPDVWADRFLTYHQWSSPWVTMVDEAAYHRAVDRFAALDVRTIATCHGPTIFPSHLSQALDLLHRVPTADVPPQPGQPLLDQIIARAADAAAA